ncbi:hypothetical protein [Actinocatenispora rupis]|uniref:Uncharacterized protein n=1 Tax=Actinocatenispora rupis TaxID=519421 RepID=A0A8J3J1E2_9ACTN|nr:hypothetical protein [Actinocatenispora rupis]GID10217.1 hypothetical protein Aru02nite_11060 [Actinocatenispora rupis]
MVRTLPAQIPATAHHTRTRAGGSRHARGQLCLSDVEVGAIAVTDMQDRVLVVDHEKAQPLVLVYEPRVGVHLQQANTAAHTPARAPVLVGRTGRDQRDGFVAGFMNRICHHSPIGAWAFRHPACAADWYAGHAAAGAEVGGPSQLEEQVWNAHTYHEALASYAAWRYAALIGSLRPHRPTQS